MSSPAGSVPNVERLGCRAASNRLFWGWLSLLVVVGVLVRWPLVWEASTVTPDGAEYLAIARSLRETGRYATDLKWQFYTADPIRHAAWVDRPPLYPLYAALCARVLPGLDPTSAARMGNVFLAGLAQFLAALYLRRLFGPVVALAATGYVFLLPHTVYWTSQPLTEALSLFLTLAALLLWSKVRAGDTARGSPLPQSHLNHEGRPAIAGAVRVGGISPHHPGEVGGGDDCGVLAAGPPPDKEGSPRTDGGAVLPWVAGVGVLCGLAYLTRPTGALLLVALLLDLCRRERPRGSEKPNHRLGTAIALLGGYLLTVAPYHFMLWQTAGSPFASALGFTFTITTIHDVTVLGFERASPTLFAFLREHAAELPGLVLRQAASHAQGLLLPLLGLLPLAFWVRREDFGGARRAGFLLVLLLLVTHTLTWSAKGSSRYFLFCLLLLGALLLSKAMVKFQVPGSRFQVPGSESASSTELTDAAPEPRVPAPTPTSSEKGSCSSTTPSPTSTSSTPGSDPNPNPNPNPNPSLPPIHRRTDTPTPPGPLALLLVAASAIGLSIELTRFLGTQLRPDHGLASLPGWKAAAERVRDAELVASDHPWILNLLSERPAVILPRTTDPAKLGRFLDRYRPDVLVLFPDELAEAAMRDAWRAGRLPGGWRVVRDEAGYLEARPEPRER